MNQQTITARIVCASVLCLFLISSVACSRTTLAPMFMAHDGSSVIDCSGSAGPSVDYKIYMLRLVEAPPGHVSGSIAISSINQEGLRNDAVHSISGSIYKDNISLQIGRESFFQQSVNVVGKLDNDNLTLSVGNSTIVFHRASQREYETELEKINKLGRHVVKINQANKQIAEAELNYQKLNTDLEDYIKWGQTRIDHLSNVRHWYADRIARYTKCLQTIRPLAEAHIPSWRWQWCVLSIENDRYNRDQFIRDGRDICLENQRRVTSLDAKIASVPQQLLEALSLMESVCPFLNDVVSCEAKVKNLKSLLGNIEKDKAVAAYRAIIPQVQNALDTDMQIEKEGENRLLIIDSQVTSLYQSASKN
ncbi:MAG: hypothetical protein M0022_02320 [Desulfobacteraceae bacterium]|nr:hypothetical protein [Desulfobacteraceae bacterium]